MTSVPLRRVAAINPPSPQFEAAGTDDVVTFMPLETVWSNGHADVSRRAIKADVATGYTRFDSGDILVPKVTPTFEAGRSCRPRIATSAGAASTEVHVVRGVDVDADFLTYVFQSLPFLTEGATTLEGVGNLRRVPADWLAGYPIWRPSDGAQREIVSFLDQETAKIDALIAKQDALVGVLRERRESAVMAAVTGAIVPGPKRDSGVRWIGEVPADWQVGNIRRFAEMHSGHTPSRQVPEYWEDCTVPWFTLADVWQLRDDTRIHLGETSEQISDLGLRNSSAELLPAGTVALSRTASVGFSGIMPRPMATSQDFWNWVCGPDLLPEFLLRVFRAMRREMRSLMAGSTHQTIYKTDAASFVIPVPPLEEQREVVQHLEQDLGRMDALVEKAIGLVAMLRERRAALITAAVTGKLDVSTYGKAG